MRVWKMGVVFIIIIGLFISPVASKVLAQGMGARSQPDQSKRSASLCQWLGWAAFVAGIVKWVIGEREKMPSYIAMGYSAMFLCNYYYHALWGPKIALIQFPTEIPADGAQVSGYVSFEDRDGDVKRIHFSVVKGDRKSLELQAFDFDPKVAGVRSGQIPFSLACRKPQQVTLRVTLVDEAGYLSAGTDFSFKCV